MKRVCAWCKKDMGFIEDQMHDEHVITHGICDPCARKFSLGISQSLRDFIDELEVPVVVFKNDEKALTANAMACEILHKKFPEIEDCRNGDIIGCPNAKKAGGCGKQVECASCVIRESILHTLKTGESRENIQAFPDIEMFGGEMTRKRIAISTERVGEVVMLRIDRFRLDGDSAE